MTSARCPACGAALASGAPWCTLCYADLREKPDPAPVSSDQPRPAGGGRHRQGGRHAATSAEPTSAPAGGIGADLLDPAFDRPVMTHADAVQTLAAELPSDAPVAKPLIDATWPCFTCGASMPMADQVCSQCGSAFLSGADAPLSVNLPGVGDVTSMTPGKRVGVMAAGALGMAIVLLLVLSVLGHFV